jgi:hypothetical protein
VHRLFVGDRRCRDQPTSRGVHPRQSINNR